MGVALALPSNSKTWLESVSKDKPSSSLGLIVSNEGKKFDEIDTWLNFDDIWRENLFGFFFVVGRIFGGKMFIEILKNNGKISIACDQKSSHRKFENMKSEGKNVKTSNKHNRTAHTRRQCQKTTVLSCHRCQINTPVEKINNILILIRTLTSRFGSN